jgi:hypothetical protein
MPEATPEPDPTIGVSPAAQAPLTGVSRLTTSSAGTGPAPASPAAPVPPVLPGLDLKAPPRSGAAGPGEEGLARPSLVDAADSAATTGLLPIQRSMAPSVQPLAGGPPNAQPLAGGPPNAASPAPLSLASEQQPTASTLGSPSSPSSEAKAVATGEERQGSPPHMNLVAPTRTTPPGGSVGRGMRVPTAGIQRSIDDGVRAVDPHMGSVAPSSPPSVGAASEADLPLGLPPVQRTPGRSIPSAPIDSVSVQRSAVGPQPAPGRRAETVHTVDPISPTDSVPILGRSSAGQLGAGVPSSGVPGTAPGAVGPVAAAGAARPVGTVSSAEGPGSASSPDLVLTKPWGSSLSTLEQDPFSIPSTPGHLAVQRSKDDKALTPARSAPASAATSAATSAARSSATDPRYPRSRPGAETRAHQALAPLLWSEKRAGTAQLVRRTDPSAAVVQRRNTGLAPANPGAGSGSIAGAKRSGAAGDLVTKRLNFSNLGFSNLDLAPLEVQPRTPAIDHPASDQPLSLARTPAAGPRARPAPGRAPTVVQRVLPGGSTEGSVTSGPVTSGSATSGPVTSGPVTSGPVTSGPQASGPLDGDLDDVARRLYPRLRAMLSAELRHDRERAGRVTDVRR